MIKISDLPANAPRACPVCSGPWTFGYIVKKYHRELGPGRPKQTYKWALECRNPGCGLGYFIGSEIEYEETEGLELIDREKRKKEIATMASKEWPEGVVCVKCGMTDSPPAAKGFCQRCYQNEWNAKKRAAGAVPKPRKAKRTAPSSTPAAKGGNLVEVHITDAACKNIGFVVDLDALSPELRDEIKAKVADKLTDRLLAGLSGK